MARQLEGRSSANYATGPAPDQILLRLFCALCLHLVQPESTSIVHPLPHWNALQPKRINTIFSRGGTMAQQSALSIGFREFDSSDYDRLTEIYKANYPDQTLSIAEVRYRDESLDRIKYIIRRNNMEHKM